MCIRLCNSCGEELEEGQVLNYELNPTYYCDEKCLREANSDLSDLTMEEMYEQDIQYYTTWHDEEE